MVRQVLENASTESLGVRMPARLESRNRCREQLLCLFSQFLLLPRILESAGADGALQSVCSPIIQIQPQ
jgi:hypothetical protein